MNNTPAPWTTRRDDTDTVAILGQYKGTTIRIAWVFCNNTDDADAKLIATAPELLELARQIILAVEIEKARIPVDIVEAAESLILKVEG